MSVKWHFLTTHPSLTLTLELNRDLFLITRSLKPNPNWIQVYTLKGTIYNYCVVTIYLDAILTLIILATEPCKTVFFQTACFPLVCCENICPTWKHKVFAVGLCSDCCLDRVSSVQPDLVRNLNKEKIILVGFAKLFNFSSSNLDEQGFVFLIVCE